MQDTFLPLLGEKKASFQYEEEKIEVCVFFSLSVFRTIFHISYLLK